MKKMQCEVCGSSEIKKISEDLFECQSCGIQYSTAEVKKLLVEISGQVKIDRTDEVNNNIKRAAQFEQVGNNTKAAEYYNAALDIDADNAVAQKKLQQIAERQELDGYFVVEPVIDPKENVRQFFEQLAITENIACDIYKEITVKAVTEKYMTFFFMKAKYQCDWKATACYKYYENQTVYKERYDRQLKRHVKEPVTEKVERIDRVPQSGTHIFSAEELVLASNCLGKQLTIENNTAKGDLLSALERQQDDKYGTYRTKRIDPCDVKKQNGQRFYKGLVLETEIDNKIYASRGARMADAASRRAAPAIENSIGGDFYENLTATRTTLSESVAYICIPVQIIEYTYKGKSYAAISDLISCEDTMPLCYPCDTELAEAKRVLQREKEISVTVPGTFWLGLVGFGIGVVLLLLAIISGDGDDYGIGIILCWLASIAFMVHGAVVKKKRINTVRDKAEEAKRRLRDPRAIALSDSYRAFMKEYSDYAELAKANAEAGAVCLCVEQTHFAVASGKQLQSVSDEAAIVSEQEQTIIRLEEEIALLKKKRRVPIILMSVFGILLIPLFVGTILLGNVNAKINQKVAQLDKIKADWTKSA